MPISVSFNMNPIDPQIPVSPAEVSDAAVDSLTKIFNSALIASAHDSRQDHSAELYSLIRTPAYSALLSSVKILSSSQGISERAAADEIIRVFRKLENLWGDYLKHEGSTYLLK